MTRAHLLCVGAVLVAAGCTDDLPVSPTYVDDVRPLLRARCASCHGPPACVPPEQGGFRLDRWDDTGSLRGVASLTERIVVRAADRGDMPPGGLPERERELLRRWQRAGSPRGEVVDDAPPDFHLTAPLPALPADEHLRLPYTVADPDGDAVVWTVGWDRRGVDGPLAGPFEAGTGTVDLDLGVLASGPDLQLVVRVRSELGEPAQRIGLVGTLTVPTRDAAPTVTLDAPAGGERFVASVGIPLRWRADDVDSPGPLTATARLFAADGTLVDERRGLDARAGEVVWKPAAAPGRYRVELEVGDGASVRAARTACELTLQ